MLAWAVGARPGAWPLDTMQPKAVYGLAAVALLGCVLSGTFAALYFSSQSSAKPAVGNSSSGAESAAALAAASTNCQRCAALLSFAHAVGACNASSNECKLAGCKAGYASCDGLLDNGCEVAIASDVDNCGACANKCPSYPNGAAACNGGVCTAVCNSTFKECDGLSATVCETNLLSNVSHCGSCGNVCPARPNAVSKCEAGSCISSCYAGFLDCKSSSTSRRAPRAFFAGDVGGALPALTNIRSSRVPSRPLSARANACCSRDSLPTLKATARLSTAARFTH